jgi:hypothetical protein
MEFILEAKFEQNELPVIVHFVSSFTAPDDNVAKTFYYEFLEGLRRKKVILFMSNYHRIDHDPELYNRSHDYINFMYGHATTKVDIDVFYIENPDQAKSVAENQVHNFFSGKDSVAHLGKRVRIPVKVTDKETREPIKDEFFYFSFEHIRPL